MAIRTVKGQEAVLTVEIPFGDANHGLNPGQPVAIGGINCIMGNNSQSAKGQRNAYYPTDLGVFEVDKPLALDLSADDADVNVDISDPANIVATADPVSATVLKVGKTYPGPDKGGTTADTVVQFVHTLR